MLSPQALHSLLGAEPFYTQGQFQELCQELSESMNPHIRQAAALALGRLDDRCAVKPLVAALQDPVETVRVAALASLGRIGAPESVEPLIAALKDNCYRVRIAALGALGHIGDRRAEEALIAALGDGDVCTRLAAAAALSEMTRTSLARARTGMDEPRTPLP